MEQLWRTSKFHMSQLLFESVFWVMMNVTVRLFHAQCIKTLHIEQEFEHVPTTVGTLLYTIAKHNSFAYA